MQISTEYNEFQILLHYILHNYMFYCFIRSYIAKENSDNVIRVGSFEETYNVVNEKGERSGYGYEYLQDIAGYAGWRYKYITSDWKNCFTQLENGEIDILGGISYTDERAENMLFPICLWGKRNITSIRMHPIWILQQEIWILLREKILVCLKII